MALSNYHDISLDNYIALGAKVKVQYKTTVHRMRESHEERIGEWQDALRAFDVGPVLRDQTDLNTLIAFFRARNGPRYAFKFRDPMDYTATTEIFGSGNGLAQTVYQLCKSYSSGLTGDTHSVIRPIFLPDSGLQIFHDGILYTSGVSVDLLTGVVTFTTAPAPGVVLSWTGTFQVPVRFTNKQILSLVEVYQNYDTDLVLGEQRTPVPSYILQETQSPDFIEVNFPTEWAGRSSMGPQYDIIIAPGEGGESNRTAQFTEAKIRFEVDFSDRTLEQLQIILRFFLARRGRLVGFRVRDITDYTATNQLLGIGNGVQTVFQLIKVYQSGSQTQIRTITKPVTALFYLDGILASPQPGLDLTTGVLGFVTPPGVGVQVTWTGTYDVPVRFDTDTFEADITGYEVHGWQGIHLVEIMTTLPTVIIENIVQSILTSVSGCATRPFPEVQPVTKYILFPGNSEPSVTQSPLQLRDGTHLFGTAIDTFNNITSLTVAFVVSHLTFKGTVFKLAGAASTQVFDVGAKVVLDTTGEITCVMGPGSVVAKAFLPAGSGRCEQDIAEVQNTIDNGICQEENNFPPKETLSANDMHVYVVTFDWNNRSMYISGSVSGFGKGFVESFFSDMCTNVNRVAIVPTKTHLSKPFFFFPERTGDGTSGVGGIDGVEKFADPSVGGEAGTLGGFGGAEAFNGWGGRMYEMIVCLENTPLPPTAILRLYHLPILALYGSLYGVGYPRRRKLSLPGVALRFRADTDVTLYDDVQINAVQEWGNQGVTLWSGRSGGAFDWRHPTQVTVSGSLPLVTTELTIPKVPPSLLTPE